MSSGGNDGTDDGNEELNEEEVDGDEVDWEFIKGIPWQYHPVRELLQEALINKKFLPTTNLWHH